MTIKIGLAGSHRTGKTTLALAIAQEKNIAFVKTDTSAVFKQQGLHPAAPMDFNTRLWIQNHIIEAAVQIWQSEPKDFITDRTPLDFMAYTLADIQGATEVDFAELTGYLTRCIDATNRFFNLLVVLQPAIPLVYEPGKAALNPAYMEHLNVIIQGLCHHDDLICPSIIIKKDIIRIEERIAAIFDTFSQQQIL
jgi:hypothetical protein